jgi:hypothetical protein
MAHRKPNTLPVAIEENFSRIRFHLPKAMIRRERGIGFRQGNLDRAGN